MKGLELEEIEALLNPSELQQRAMKFVTLEQKEQFFKSVLGSNAPKIRHRLSDLDS